MSAREPVHRTHFVARATPAEVYAVVTDFPAYPRLFPEFKQARVVSTTGNVVRVEFSAEVVIAVRYVLDLACDPAALTVDWTFVEGEIVTGSTGAGGSRPSGDGTTDRLPRRAGREGAVARLHPAPGHRRAGRGVAAQHVRVDRARGAQAPGAAPQT